MHKCRFHQHQQPFAHVAPHGCCRKLQSSGNLLQHILIHNALESMEINERLGVESAECDEAPQPLEACEDSELSDLSSRRAMRADSIDESLLQRLDDTQLSGDIFFDASSSLVSDDAFGFLPLACGLDALESSDQTQEDIFQSHIFTQEHPARSSLPTAPERDSPTPRSTPEKRRSSHGNSDCDMDVERASSPAKRRPLGIASHHGALFSPVALL